MFYKIYTLRLYHILATDVKSIKTNLRFSLFYEKCIIVLYTSIFTRFSDLSISDFFFVFSYKTSKYRISCSYLPNGDI